MTIQKKDEGNGGISPVAAAVTGAVIGAGVAVAGAVALSDEKNRDKVKKVLTNVKKQAVSYIEDIQKQARDKENDVEEKLTEGKEKVKKVTTAVKDSLHDEEKSAKK